MKKTKATPKSKIYALAPEEKKAELKRIWAQIVKDQEARNVAPQEVCHG